MTGRNEPETNGRWSPVVPLVALLIASAACVALMGLRVIWTGQSRYLFLIGNLFLAWLPLLFAWGVCRQQRSGLKLYALAALWLLFFPNAPYIFTDLIHLNGWFRSHYWLDLTLILLFALTGFTLGFVSLYLMHSVVAERAGRVAGWLFILAVAGLGGFGIFLGRILRWSSWDALLHPFGITRDIGHLARHPLANAGSLAFPILFAAFLFLGYLMLYALTHLQPAGLRSAHQD